MTADWQQFAQRWSSREQQFQHYAAAPWWAPGLVVTPALRAEYERFLPVLEWARDLAALARWRLPDDTWLPRPLRNLLGTGHANEPTPPWPSLPDCWRTLPTSLAGRVVLSETELPRLWCALANPARFGTGFGRYPAQLCELRQLARDWANAARNGESMTLLDVGCGTGEGTAEAAAALAVGAGHPVQATGLTFEPLEVALAEKQGSALQAIAGEKVTLTFAVGDALALPAAPRVDVVLINGLVGGDWLDRPESYTRLLNGVRPLLRTPQSGVLLAHHFHAGRISFFRQFLTQATAMGWQVTGGLAGHATLRWERDR